MNVLIMRITGGLARGIPLQTPKTSKLRPATDQMREAVFSSLGAVVEGSRFIDLFAGSGAYGLEALSRGARGGVFVEKDRRTAVLLKENVRAVARSMGREDPEVRVVASDSFKWRPLPGERADILFLDPPYADVEKWTPSLFALFHAFLIEGGKGIVVFEMPGALAPDFPGWRCFRQIGKGKTAPTCRFFEPIPR